MSAYRLEDKSSHADEKMLVVFQADTPIGFVTKYKNTRTEKHPWKSFYYTQRPARRKLAIYETLGPFYGRQGKKQALEAIQTRFEGEQS